MHEIRYHHVRYGKPNSRKMSGAEPGPQHITISPRTHEEICRAEQDSGVSLSFWIQMNQTPM